MDVPSLLNRLPTEGYLGILFSFVFLFLFLVLFTNNTIVNIHVQVSV